MLCTEKVLDGYLRFLMTSILLKHSECGYKLKIWIFEKRLKSILFYSTYWHFKNRIFTDKLFLSKIKHIWVDYESYI